MSSGHMYMQGATLSRDLTRAFSVDSYDNRTYNVSSGHIISPIYNQVI